MKRHVVFLAIVYMTAGVLATALFSFLTGVAQFGAGVPGNLEVPLGSRIVERAGDLLVGYVCGRLLPGILVAASLAWCVRRSLRVPSVLAVGAALPAVFEVMLARPYSSSWVGMAFANLYYWPSVPRYIMPADDVLLVATAYIGPAVLTGLVAAACAVATKERAEPSPRMPAPGLTAQH